MDAGRWRCVLDVSLSVKRLLPCAPHPPASLGLRLSRNFSGKRQKKPQAQPPPPSRSMRAGLGGKFGARVCKCESGTCARAVRGGAVRSHNEGNRFFSPPPTFRRCASALGQLPWPLEGGGAEPKRSNRCSARLRSRSSLPNSVLRAACGSVFDMKCV